MVIEKLQKVNQPRVFEYASDQIRMLIKSRQILPGEKLPTEQELCDALSMSRSSIREALRVLEAEGLIEVRRGTGSYVTSETSKILSTGDALNWLKPRGESLFQILQVRESIERLTVVQAAKSRPDELISELTLLTNQLSDIVKQDESKIDFTEITSINTHFHLAISKASGNDVAHEILRHLLVAFSESNKAVIFVDLKLNHQISEHKAIFEAIKAGDPILAEKAMQNHIGRVIKEVEQICNEV